MRWVLYTTMHQLLTSICKDEAMAMPPAALKAHLPYTHTATPLPLAGPRASHAPGRHARLSQGHSGPAAAAGG